MNVSTNSMIADQPNNRIQVYAPGGEYLKTIRIDRPNLLQIHQKTGAIYVLHQGRVRGESVDRLTKLTSFEDPRKEYHVDGFTVTAFALDSWTPKPRLWIGGGGSEGLALPDRVERIESVEDLEQKVLLQEFHR